MTVQVYRDASILFLLIAVLVAGISTYQLHKLRKVASEWELYANTVEQQCAALLSGQLPPMFQYEEEQR